ncbi:hypothetical protein FQN49_002056 [Arthroderma sp. PD_2]|nr:hypothetical protein FQN49_002056 [Arthroderma sp. PD_2]
MFRHKHHIHAADLSDTDSEEEFFHRIHRRPRDNIIVEDRRRPRSTSEVHRRRPGDAQVFIDINNEQGLQGNTRLAPPQPIGRARSVSRRRPAVAEELSDLEDEIIRHERRAIRRLQREEPSHRAEIEAEVRLERIRERERELDEMRKEEARMRREEERIRREDRIRREERERLEGGNSGRGRHEETEWEREFRIAKEEEIRSMRLWRKMQERKELQDLERSEKRPERDPGMSRREIEKELQLERLKKAESDDIARRKIEDALLIERMKALEEEREEKEHERKIRAKVEAEIAQRERDEMERLQKEMKLKAGAIEEYKKREAEKELKRREEEEKANKEFTDKVNQLFGAAGLSEEKIAAVLEGKPIKEKEILQIEHIPHGKHRKRVEEEEEAFVKVHRRYVDPRTLDAFSLTWEYDPNDADYMLIYHVLCQEDQDRLFEHTRKLRGQRVLTASPHNGPVMVEMKVNDKKKDGMFLVRKKADRRGLFW